jgi:hypothetical protein
MKNFKLNSLLLTLLAGFALTACNSGTKGITNSSTNSPKAAPPLTITSSGLGLPTVNMDSSTSNTDIRVLPGVDSCIDQTELQNTPIHADNQSGEFNYHTDMTTQDILNSMGINASLKGGYNDLSGDFSGKFQNAVSNSTNQMSYTFVARNEADIHLDKSLSLSDANLKSATISTCGDSYISTTTAGIYFTATVRLLFANSSDKNTIQASGNIKYGSLVDLAGSLNKINSTIAQRTTIEVDIAQRGGDVNSLFTILQPFNLQNQGSDTTPFYVAQLSLDNVGTFVNRIQEYVASFNTNPKNQLDLNGIKTMDSVANLYASTNHILVSPYSNGTLDFKVSPELTSAINAHDGAYQNLNTSITNFNNYYNIVIAAGLADTAPLGIQVYQTMDPTTLGKNMQSQALSCYGYNTDNVMTNCITLLNNQTAQANSEIASIESSGYDKVYKVRSSANGTILNPDNEYLIPLGQYPDGSEGFVTYSTNPLLSHFASGTTYLLTPDGTFSMISPNNPIDSLVPQSRSINATTTPIAIGADLPSLLSFKNISYLALDDQNTDSKTYTMASTLMKVLAKF